MLDAAGIAEKLGNERCMNVVLLGALVKLMDLESLDWDAALKSSVKPKFLEINQKLCGQGLPRFPNRRMVEYGVSNV